MNERSLAYNNIDLQHKSSWIDDPFQFGTNAIKGLNSMNYRQTISDYAYGLVEQYSHYDCVVPYLLLSNLPDDEQNELVRLYIESTGRELTECVNGNDFSIDNDYSCALLAMLQDDCKETRDKFAQVTRNNILAYYKNSLDDILTTACNYYHNDFMSDSGYKAHQDNENGEIMWRKSA